LAPVHTDAKAESRRRPLRVLNVDVRPDRSAWAVLSAPSLASYADRNPAVELWREFCLDPDLAGIAVDVRRSSELTIECSAQSGSWLVPVTGALGNRLAWHPSRSLVAGLSVRGRRAQPWIADYRARTVRHFPQVRAATSLTEFGHPPLQSLVWYDEDRLLLLTAEHGVRSTPAAALSDPVVYEAHGPAHVAFQPGLDQLAELAGVAVSILETDTGSTEVLTSSRLLIRGLVMSAEGPVVEYLDGTEPGTDELRWAAGLLDVDGRSTRLRPTSFVPAQAPVPPPPGSLDLADGRSDTGPDRPSRMLEVPTGHGHARLSVWPPTGERSGSGPALLWIRAWRRDGGPLPAANLPMALTGTGYTSAVLDLPLHWPSDATVELVHDQIVRAVHGSLDDLAGHGDIDVVVGGYSFGATLALYALVHLPELKAAIVHNGCYNRTLTPTGFQYERRSYWEAPELYHAFSALLFADRIDRPVLIVHGAEDTNPATTPDQAVHLYQGVVAAGGHARLVLVPNEGHLFQYQETQQALVEAHRQWLARWDRQPVSASAGG
jgi:dienelactone hydrolase